MSYCLFFQFLGFESLFNSVCLLMSTNNNVNNVIVCYTALCINSSLPIIIITVLPISTHNIKLNYLKGKKESPDEQLIILACNMLLFMM